MGEQDLDAAIRAKLDADAAWREASGPGFEPVCDGPEIAAEAAVYARALAAVVFILHAPHEADPRSPYTHFCMTCLAEDGGTQAWPCPTVRMVARELGVEA